LLRTRLAAPTVGCAAVALAGRARDPGNTHRFTKRNVHARLRKSHATFARVRAPWVPRGGDAACSAHRDALIGDGRITLLTSTARQPVVGLRGVWTPAYGYGIVDAEAAVQAAQSVC
jgi:hypothetical protein